jgi:gamma-glutamyltranspeptidase/glutathione hydrolase
MGSITYKKRMARFVVGLGRRDKRRRAVGLLAAAAVAGVLGAALPSRAAFAPAAEGTRLAVATDHAEATRAALEALRAGGNAFDGAVAASLALGVVSPAASGIGGGGFCVAWSAKEQRVFALDFRETAPAGLVSEELLERKMRGVLVGVPGEPAGLEWLHVHYGKRTLAEDAAPAVDLATRGFPVGRYLADAIGKLRPMVEQSPELRASLLPGGSPIAYRATLRNPDLGTTLRRFGTEGSKPFYLGDLALRIADAATAAGGHMTPKDLAAYRVRERVPLQASFGGRTVYTMPAPSAGGLMLLETLGLYGADASSPLARTGFGSSAHLHFVAEAARGATADRARIAGDPDLDPQVLAAYAAALDGAHLSARRASIAADRTHAAAEFRTREDGTSHLIVADAEGNVVSLTTTVNGPFGARVVVPDAGILLNDQLGDFAVPDDVKGFGVVGLGPNRPRPMARPVSSMAPTIVLEQGQPILALGGSGGRRIATGVTQAAVCRLVFGLDPATCVSSPRFYTAGKDLLVDPEVAEDVRAGLRSRGETVVPETMFGSAVQMVAWDRGPAGVRVFAASDPRKMGFAAAL